jgi:hypothetical protein
VSQKKSKLSYKKRFSRELYTCIYIHKGPGLGDGWAGAEGLRHTRQAVPERAAAAAREGFFFKKKTDNT